MAAYRWIDLTESADRIICFRPPAHVIPHPNKVLWFIHHIRIFYDLWESQYRDFPADNKHLAIRDVLHRADTSALLEAKHVFTNSKIVGNRLRRFNGFDSEVLYPPILNPEQFRCDSWNNEVVYLSRMEHHKRQHLLIEAMQHTRTDVRLRLCGLSASSSYAKNLQKLAASSKAANRITLENRWISEEEKAAILANCLAAAYIPLDEDSYGYPSLEASHSSKPILTTDDSGGVLELVTHDQNGFVSESSPVALAEAMDRLNSRRAATKDMGLNAKFRIEELGISWPRVLERLLR